MDILKQEIQEQIHGCVLLGESEKKFFLHKLETLHRFEDLVRIQKFFAQEKKFIIMYLKKIINLDTHGLTVVKLRNLMQMAYLNNMRNKESVLRADESTDLEHTLSHLD